MIIKNNGELIDYRRLLEISKEYDKIPDYKEGRDKKIHPSKFYESPGILGRLYRSLKKHQKHELLISDLYYIEYKTKIARKYNFNQKLYQSISEFSKIIYTEVVKPMSRELK